MSRWLQLTLTVSATLIVVIFTLISTFELKQHAAIDTRLGSIETVIAQLSDRDQKTATENHARIEALDSRVNDLREAVRSAEMRLGELQRQVGALEGYVYPAGRSRR